jgi:hypothetical protein
LGVRKRESVLWGNQNEQKRPSLSPARSLDLDICAVESEITTVLLKERRGSEQYQATNTRSRTSSSNLGTRFINAAIVLALRTPRRKASNNRSLGLFQIRKTESGFRTNRFPLVPSSRGNMRLSESFDIQSQPFDLHAQSIAPSRQKRQ